LLTVYGFLRQNEYHCWSGWQRKPEGFQFVIVWAQPLTSFHHFAQTFCLTPSTCFLARWVFVWSKWTAPGECGLLSFTAILGEQPLEVAAVGHDRRVVPIKE
jgi:hypothetical protein